MKFTFSTVGLVLGVAVMAWPARAEQDVPLDTRIIRGFMEGIGLRKDEGNQINYQERAPLVLPPGRDLPSPEKSGEAAIKNPAWPKDPDLARSKLEAERERDRDISAEREREAGPLRPDQITPGAKSRSAARRSTTSGASSNPIPGGEVLSPAELGSKRSIFSGVFSKDEDEVAKFTGEPPRSALTAPPKGYQTPSPDQPYGVTGNKNQKPTNYLETHGTVEGTR